MVGTRGLRMLSADLLAERIHAAHVANPISEDSEKHTVHPALNNAFVASLLELNDVGADVFYRSFIPPESISFMLSMPVHSAFVIRSRRMERSILTGSIGSISAVFQSAWKLYVTTSTAGTRISRKSSRRTTRFLMKHTETYMAAPTTNHRLSSQCGAECDHTTEPAKYWEERSSLLCGEKLPDFVSPD